MDQGAFFSTHPLQRSWKIYLHYPLYTSSTESYGSAAYREIFDFNSVEDFWKHFECLPLPSQVFATDHRPRVKVGGRILEGMGIFQEGVEPEWEKTTSGGHWEISGIASVELIDVLWEACCLSLIGETTYHTQEVVGIRVVDKSKSRKPMYRVEIWLSTQDENVRIKVMDNLQKAFKQDNQHCLDFPQVWKYH